MNIAVEEEVDEYSQGWEGQAKGLLQVLWERGFVNKDDYKNFSMHGKKDQYGNIDHSTSLVRVMSSPTEPS